MIQITKENYELLYKEVLELRRKLDMATKALEQIKEVHMIPSKTTPKDIASWVLERIGE